MSTLYEGQGWKITLDAAKLPDGREKKVARVHRADSAHIIAFAKSGNILMLREFRPYYGAYVWMLPSGRIDKENDVEAGAQRELQEETGWFAKELTHLWTVNHSESIVSSNHIFLARNLTKAPLPQDEDELIEVHEMPIEEGLKNILESQKVHLPSAFALMRYMREKM